MKLQNKLAIALGVAVLSSTATAKIGLDLRHEYRPFKNDTATHSSRFKIGDNFNINKKWKSNLSLEIKFKGQDTTKFLEQVYINELELDMGLTYKLGKEWQIKPGMPINVAFEEPDDSRANGQHLYHRKTTFKPQLRIQHQSRALGLKTALRARVEVVDYRSNQNGDTTRAGDGVTSTGSDTNPKTLKMTLTGAYKMPVKALKNLKLSWEANYIRSLDNVRKGLADDTYEVDFDAGIFVGYQLGAWRPYVEAWNVRGTDAKTDRRGYKYRIGLKYKF